MNVTIEFNECIFMFGEGRRHRETLTIPTCGKNRRDAIVKKEVKKKFPNLTLNRIVGFNLSSQ
ncbi:MAG: hypothetical protein PF569_09140 [Candidatus Woesearchaeota archaeon]|jgi:hypothetical protein|nr:hypothetical protein [Candidatus Woesearchaeota archaeon]